MANALEIERKWLMNSLPNFTYYLYHGLFKTVKTRQIYINGIRLREIKSTDIILNSRQDELKYYMTTKSAGIMSRRKWEVEIPRWVFNTLANRNPDCPSIIKTVYKAGFQGLILEFHVFSKPLWPLVILECEFPNEEVAHNFELPDWVQVTKEVTEDERYQNINLAVTGLPKD